MTENINKHNVYRRHAVSINPKTMQLNKALNDRCVSKLPKIEILVMSLLKESSHQNQSSLR